MTKTQHSHVTVLLFWSLCIYWRLEVWDRKLPDTYILNKQTNKIPDPILSTVHVCAVPPDGVCTYAVDMVYENTAYVYCTHVIAIPC
jgi:hypothetical protein